MSALPYKRPAHTMEGKENLPMKRPASDTAEQPIQGAHDFFEGVDDAPEAVEEVDEGVLGEAGRNWVRPDPPPYNPSSDNLVFQQLELDYINGPPNKKFYSSDLKEVPILRMFGVTAQGNSVCLFVHGFEPYFYLEAPTSTFSPDDCRALADMFNNILASKDRSGNARVCLHVEVVQKQTMMYYQPVKSRPFLKVTMAVPGMIAPARSLVEGGLWLDWLACRLPQTTYESNVLYVLRFMVDSNIVGGNWVEAVAGSWTLVPAQARISHCQLEAHVAAKDLVSHEAEGEWARLAPFRILSVDIECQGRKGHFPEAQHDPVIQIASMVTVMGETAPVVKNVMTLRSCAPIAGAEVMSFEDEKELLLRWRDLILETDPDIIIGYNIINFDLPYLLDRATTLGLPQFWTWGRMRNRRCKVKDARFSSKAYGTHEYKEIGIEGRVQFDLLQAIRRDHNLSSYSLNSVSAHFLGEQKEDVHHSDISKLQDGNAETRRRLAIYCLKDAYLPQRLLDKLMCVYNYVEMARVTGVPLSFLLARGQSIKVFSQILRKTRSRGLLVPNMKRLAGGAQEGGGVAYEGATVLEPKAGYYATPVATLDFASLYPSIMMAHNLCYSTLLPRSAHAAFPAAGPGARSVESPSGERFVRAELQAGVLPEILRELLAARKRARADMAAAGDPFARAVLNGRQLALKVSANSVYGFTGATVGALPCLEISSSVTSFGRTMIEATKLKVMDHFTRRNGYEADADVVYGDTDSVMVDFGVASTERAMALGEEAAALVSGTFVAPIKLEFEKVYNPYLLISKKRYAGLLWTRPERWDKIDTKGIETVRRDNCLLVRNVVSTCLDLILVQRSPERAAEYVKGVIAELLQNRLDLSLLVVSKGLTQDADDYETKAAHVELAKKMKKRDPATAPAVGDRVPYVIVKASKGAKAYEKAEDPIYALKNNLPIDCQHYLDHHLAQPLLRLFEPILKNPRELLCGPHTRTITVSTPSSASGGIMRFAQKKAACLGCKAALGPGETVLCRHCAPREADVLLKTQAALDDLEGQFAALWTQCQRCQGSLHLDVLCRSRDCPIFYRRMKVQKEVNEAAAAMARFDDW